MNNVKENRIASFASVFIIYVIASIAGIFIYSLLDFDWWLALLVADVLATVITFIFSLILWPTLRWPITAVD